jgi:hypothetical protein
MVGLGIWLETMKYVKNGKFIPSGLGMARKVKNVENEIHTLLHLKYGD